MRRWVKLPKTPEARYRAKYHEHLESMTNFPVIPVSKKKGS